MMFLKDMKVYEQLGTTTQLHKAINSPRFLHKLNPIKMPKSVFLRCQTIDYKFQMEK